MSSLRILHVIESTGAGVGRHVLDLASGLSAIGNLVHIAYSPLRAEPSFLARLAATRCTPIELPMRRSIGLSDAAAVAALRAYLRRNVPYDIIHGHSSKGGAVARIGGVFGASKIVYTPNAFASMDESASWVKNRTYSLIEQGLSKITDRIICVSPEEAAFATRIGLPSRKIRLIPNGIEDIEYPSREKVRAELGLEASAPVVGFVGRMSRQKAADQLLIAFALVLEAMPGARLVLVGEGELMPRLQSDAQRLGIADRVLWLGWRDGKGVMPAFDLLALPSRFEGLPYVGLEAISAGLPVVATAAANVSLLVQDGINGAIVPNERPELFGRALVRILEQAQRSCSMRAVSRSVAAGLTLERMVDGTLRVYAEVV